MKKSEFNHKEPQGTTRSIVIGLLISLIFPFVLTAQNPYLNGVNDQLRHIFSQLTYPNNDVLFLYDRSAKISDTTFYASNSPDTTNTQIWKQVYSEMYYAAHDTLPFETNSDIDSIASQFGGDTIPIGLLDKED